MLSGMQKLNYPVDVLFNILTSVLQDHACVPRQRYLIFQNVCYSDVPVTINFYTVEFILNFFKHERWAIVFQDNRLRIASCSRLCKLLLDIKKTLMATCTNPDVIWVCDLIVVSKCCVSVQVVRELRSWCDATVKDKFIFNIKYVNHSNSYVFCTIKPNDLKNAIFFALIFFPDALRIISNACKKIVFRVCLLIV